MSKPYPLISILMAVYDPNLEWFREQLNSLNTQSYPRIHLYIIDDHSPTIPFDEIKQIVKECITNFPFSITRNDYNLGSNKTFEILTKHAEGDYFAYCDQDDIWLSRKLSVLYETINASGALLVCSNMYVIDGEGQIRADSITHVRRRHIFHSGQGLLPVLIVSNFVTGCTMLVSSTIAKSAIPFCPYMVHDHYLALYASNKGLILSLPEKLIYYRIHGNNQTHTLSEVIDKKSYYERYIKVSTKKITWIRDNFICNDNDRNYILKVLDWQIARESWYQRKPGALYNLWKLRAIKFSVTLFELLFIHLPNPIFKIVLWLIKRNII